MRRADGARACCALFLALGCHGASGPPDEVIAELDALARGPNRALAVATALVAPGTLLLSAPDDNLLTAINGRLGTETTDCAKRTQVPGTLSVDLNGGSGNGCTLQTGVITLKGSMTITIARDGPTVRILDHMDLTAEDEPLTGEIAIATSDGNQFSYLSLAALSGHTFNLPSFTGQPIDSTTVVTATGNTPGAGTAMRALTYTSVKQRFTACHAEAGSLQLTSPSEGIDRTLTYADDTPQTGNANLLDAGVTTTVAVPRITSCPPAPPS